MSFYQQIAPYYHHIFKINVNQVDFIKLKIPGSDCNLLDIGCGIGTLSFELINGINLLSTPLIRLSTKRSVNYSCGGGP